MSLLSDRKSGPYFLPLPDILFLFDITEILSTSKLVLDMKTDIVVRNFEMVIALNYYNVNKLDSSTMITSNKAFFLFNLCTVP